MTEHLRTPLLPSLSEERRDESGKLDLEDTFGGADDTLDALTRRLGEGLCKYKWFLKPEATCLVQDIHQFLTQMGPVTEGLFTIRRVPQRYCSMWTYESTVFYRQVVHDLHVTVMEREDVDCSVRSMCLSFLIHEDPTHAPHRIRQAWHWLRNWVDGRHDRDPDHVRELMDMMDVMYTHRHLVPDLPVLEWLADMRFQNVEYDDGMDGPDVHGGYDHDRHDDNHGPYRNAEGHQTAPPVRVLEQNVLTDRQNVHTEGVMEGFRESVAALLHPKHLSRLGYMGDRYEYCVSVMREDRRMYNDRVLHDPTPFRIDHRTLRLLDIFVLVHRTALTTASHPKEALNRLAEELADASATCSSGHATRIVSALAGLHPGVHIGISTKDQVKLYIQQCVQTAAQRDEVVWFEGKAFDRWVRKALVRDLLASFYANDQIGEATTWAEQFKRIFPACTVKPFGFWRRNSFLVSNRFRQMNDRFRAAWMGFQSK